MKLANYELKRGRGNIHLLFEGEAVARVTFTNEKCELRLAHIKFTLEGDVIYFIETNNSLVIVTIRPNSATIFVATPNKRDDVKCSVVFRKQDGGKWLINHNDYQNGSMYLCLETLRFFKTEKDCTDEHIHGIIVRSERVLYDPKWENLAFWVACYSSTNSN